MARTEPQRVLITGATTGLGYHAAHILAAKGYHVIAHARNKEKAEATHAAILAETPDAHVETITADLGISEETRAFGEEIDARLPRLDALVLNAGLYNRQRRETPEGIEETFAVNHLSQFLLVERLHTLIRRSPGLRIIVVASQAHHSARLDLDDLEMQKGKYSGWLQYSNTKLMNLLFTRALGFRLKPHGVTVNAIHPGVVATGIVRSDWRARPLFRFFGLPAKQGAHAIVHLVEDDAGRAYTGHYFVDQKPRRPRSAALSDTLAERLWERSAEYATRLATP